MKLDHVSLNVADRPRSIEWYRPFQAASPAPERDSETAGLRHFAFRVGAQELKRVKGQLGEKGVRFNAEDHRNAHSVYFRDPDSNTIEFTTYEV